MLIEKDELEEKSEREILRTLVEQVTKSEEEIENKTTRQGKDPDLKIYVADKKGFELGSLRNHLQELVNTRAGRKPARDFIREHSFEEELLNENVSFVSIHTSDYNRTDEFVFIDREEYIWILTTERSKWTQSTIENLLKYLPELKRLYLSSDDLEEVIGGLVDGSVSGFTSKYHSPFKNRDATLRFHGAEEGDIEEAKRSFDAEPTRIEFDQKNSPETAIQGSNSNNGYATIESVKQGSEQKAVDTLWKVLSDNEEHDRKNYSIEQEIVRRELDNGCAVDGFTSVELTKGSGEVEEEGELATELEDEVLSKQMYEYGMWGEKSFFVYDIDHGETFEVGVEEPNLVVHAQEETTEVGLRAFCENVIEEFDSTYDIDRKQMKAGEPASAGG